jgi:hypothetical protein
MTTQHASATHDDISRRAFEIWCENGRRPGTASDDWHAAERDLEREGEHTDLSAAHAAQDAIARTAAPARPAKPGITFKPAGIASRVSPTEPGTGVGRSGR